MVELFRKVLRKGQVAIPTKTETRKKSDKGEEYA